MFIHYCKNTNTRPTTPDLKKYIKNIESTERNIATGKGRKPLLNHLEKWSEFIKKDITEDIIEGIDT